jgi:hypothetical protein
MTTQKEHVPGHDSDEHMGAVEGDTATDPQKGNAHAQAIDDQGRPKDKNAECEDVIGANEDGTEG